MMNLIMKIEIMRMMMMMMRKNSIILIILIDVDDKGLRIEI